MATVKIGDVIEFAPLARSSPDGERHRHSPSKPLSTGKVVDLLETPTGPECVVQISPFEPLRRLNLCETYHKVWLTADFEHPERMLTLCARLDLDCV